MRFEEFVRLFPQALPHSVTAQQRQVIETIDKEILEQQIAAISRSQTISTTSIEPIECDRILNTAHPQIEFFGKKIGLIVLAGGQATRLNSTLPKGVLPFELGTGKSLFNLIADRLQAYGLMYGSIPNVAVMTSQFTDAATRQHFSDHHNFGLQQVAFFAQPSLPLITRDEHIAVDSSGHILFGPDGNGSVFKSFAASGLLQEWINQRIDAIGIIMIDNPLLDPFHPDLYLPVFRGIQLTAAAIVRKDPSEQVGLFVRYNQKIHVVEYSEIDKGLQQRRKENGSLLYSLANITFFVMTPATAAMLASITTGLHAAKKMTSGQEVWKSEYFIFDYLPYVDSVQVIPIDKIRYFAPIKDQQTFEQAQKKRTVKSLQLE